MKILIFLFVALHLFADVKQNMFNLYQNEKYEKVCHIGFTHFGTNKKDEEFVSLYAFACLKADYIDRLAIPIIMLKNSQEARANSAYFSVILMQKNLLFHALIDNYNVTNLTLPTTDNILSKVFNLYSKLAPHKPRAFYLFEDTNDKKITYKLYVLKKYKRKNIVIEKYYNDVKLAKHIYW